MSYKNITSILHQNELKLLVCGERNCSIEQMKKLTNVSTPSLKISKITKDDLVRMFWNVMKNIHQMKECNSFGFQLEIWVLPAPGLKLDKKIICSYFIT